jgi:hypothetical protein
VAQEDLALNRAPVGVCRRLWARKTVVEVTPEENEYPVESALVLGEVRSLRPRRVGAMAARQSAAEKLPTLKNRFHSR